MNLGRRKIRSGRLRQAAMRGDGDVGDNITQNMHNKLEELNAALAHQQKLFRSKLASQGKEIAVLKSVRQQASASLRHNASPTLIASGR
jgi:NAD-dependent DNA ligase